MYRIRAFSSHGIRCALSALLMKTDISQWHDLAPFELTSRVALDCRDLCVSE